MKTLRARAAGAALIAALMLASCGGANTKSPDAVAHAFMDAYKKKDAAGMLALMAPDGSNNREILSDAAKEGPASDAYKEVFDPEMMKMMTGAGAKFEGPRYDPEGRPVFKVAEDQGDAFTLTLEQTKGAWSIYRLGNISLLEFKALADKPAKTS